MESLRADLSADGLKSVGVLSCDEFHTPQSRFLIIKIMNDYQIDELTQ
jgi:hypothetical protein